LDNPAWSALISGNNNLANGNDEVKYFDEEVSLFAGLKENSPKNFQLLYEQTPHKGPVGFVSTEEIEIPKPWKVVQFAKALQMVHDGQPEPIAENIELKPLTIEHVPEMLALTQLTVPGPFTPRTIEFGHYYGVFDGDKLVAMTGQRLHVFEYAEISAVCTHPDYLGRGYARQLLLFHLNRIRAASNIPFLHVRAGNTRAIEVYKHVGFSTRREIYFYYLQKN